MPNVPYADASAGHRARSEIATMLQKVGCTQVGFIDNFQTGELVLTFMHRGRPFLLRASARGWAFWFLRENPWHARRKVAEAEWSDRAMRQGMVAVSSILRDWCRGQITAIECGILSFEAAFGLHLVGTDGQPMVETPGFQKLLSPPNGDPQ